MVILKIKKTQGDSKRQFKTETKTLNMIKFQNLVRIEIVIVSSILNYLINYLTFLSEISKNFGHF